MSRADWFSAYCNTLDPHARSMIIQTDSDKIFKLRGRVTKKSVGSIKIPCALQGKTVALTLDMVQQANLSCLLSSHSIEKAGGIIDYPKKKVTLFGRQVDVMRTQFGYPVIQLDPYKPTEEQTVQVLYQLLDGKINNQNFKKIMKMHHNLGHPREKVLQHMLKDAGQFDQNTKYLLD